MLRSFTSKLLATATTAAAASSSSLGSSTTAAGGDASSSSAAPTKGGPEYIGRRKVRISKGPYLPTNSNTIQPIRRRVKSPKIRGLLSNAVNKPLPEGSAEIKQKLMESYIGGSTVASPSVTPAAANAASANNNKFAVVSVGNLQYKVSVGDVISAQRMSAAVGSRIALKKVLMVGGVRFTAIGRPLLANCRVIAEVEEHKRFKGILNYTHYKGRHFKKLQYSEHAVTMLRIVEVTYDPQIVGEVDRDTGILLPAKNTLDPSEPAPSCYYKDELPKMAPNVNKPATAGKK